MKKILIFSLFSISAFAQRNGLIDADTTTRPKAGISALAFNSGNLKIIRNSGNSYGVVTTNNTYANPSWLASIALAKVTGLQSALDAKVNVVSGKGLSTEDYTTTEKSKLAGIASGATANSTDAQLRDRSTHTGTQANTTITGLGTASTLNVAASGNAASGEVVKGNDTRLSDARTPTTHTHSQSDVSYLSDTLALKVEKSVTSMIENKSGLALFFKKIYSFLAAISGNTVGIAWYGDSVSGDVSGEFITGIGNNFNLNNLNYPAGVRSSIGLTTTGTIRYAGGGLVNQSIFNGVVGATITRSGSVATLTSSSPHGLTVGKYVTVSGATQSEYNGIFQVASVPTTTTLTYTVSGTPATPATGSINCYGGLADFTYMPNASNYSLENGATILLDAGQNSGFEKFRLFFARELGLGSVSVELLNEAGNTVLSTTSLSCSNATLDATHLDIATPNKDLKYKVRITSTGKSIFLACYPLLNNGIVSINLGMGGSSFAQNNYSNNTVLDYIISTMNVGVVFVQAKEEGLPGSLNGLATRLNRYTNTSKFIVGSLPDVTSAAVQEVNNEYFRQLAKNNGYAFFDGYKAIGSYQKLVNMGWITDGTHPHREANRFCADLILGEMSINNIVGIGSKLSIDQRNAPTSLSVFHKVGVVSPAPDTPIEVIEAWGGGAPTLAKIKNVREMHLGNGAAYTKIAGYGTYGVAAVKHDDTWAEMRAGYFASSNSQATTLDGLHLRGYDGSSTIYQSTLDRGMTLLVNGGKIILNAVHSANNLVLTNTGIGINTATPSASSALDITSTTKGVLFPRMTTAQINAISSPANGLMVYNTDLSTLCFYNGSAWQKVTSTNMN